MRTLDRYLVREFLKLFLLVTVAAPLLFVLGDVTDNLDTYLNREIPPARVALSYLYMLPQFALWSLPISALVATVFTVNAMTRHSEMVAAKAGGISFYRVVATLPLLGLLLTAGGLALSEVVPIALRARAELIGERRSTGGARSTFVHRAESGTVLSIQQLDARTGRMFRPVVEREGDRASIPGMHLIANHATFDSTGVWRFNDGYLRLFPSIEDMREFKFDTLVLPELEESPEQLLAQPKEADEMRYAELGRFIEMLERAGSEPHKLRVDQASKLAIPAATLVIILFGAPLANSQARSGPAFGVGISLGITILYLMMFRVSEAVGAAGWVSPLLAAWAPNVVFFVAGLFLMARVRT